MSFSESPINGERNINKTSPSSKTSETIEPISPVSGHTKEPVTTVTSGNSVILDTSKNSLYQSVFANSLSNGNRNNVGAPQQKQQYRDAAVVSPNTTSK